MSFSHPSFHRCVWCVKSVSNNHVSHLMVWVCKSISILYQPIYLSYTYTPSTILTMLENDVENDTPFWISKGSPINDIDLNQSWCKNRCYRIIYFHIVDVNSLFHLENSTFVLPTYDNMGVNNLPISHLVPRKSREQKHRTSKNWSWHVPLFKQGLLKHSSISAYEYKIKNASWVK